MPLQTSPFRANVRGELRRRIWAPALIMLLMMLVLPLRIAMRLNQYVPHFGVENTDPYLLLSMQDMMSRCFGYQGSMLSLTLIVCSFASAMVFFSYLMNSAQVNFYHSLPQTRRQLFATHYLAGWLAVVLPYLAGLVLSLIICFAMGFGSMLQLSLILQGVAVNLFYITAIYSLVALAAVLSGSVMANLLIGLYFLFIGPLAVYAWRLRVLLQPAWYVQSEVFLTWLTRVSPLTQFLMLSNSTYPSNQLSWLNIGITAIVTVLAVLLSLLLYQRRPLESAGRALVFPKARGVLKYTLIICGGLCAGRVFQTIGGTIGSGVGAWYFIGLLLGGVIIGQVVEIIYHSDFRACGKKLLPSLLVTAVLLGGSAVLVADPAGFNSYLPPAAQVSAVDVRLSSLEQFYISDSFSNMNAEHEEELYVSTDDILWRGHTENADSVAAVLSMVQKLLEQGKAIEEVNYTLSANHSFQLVGWQIFSDVTDSVYLSDDRHNYTMLTVRYYLKDGSVETRNYQMIIDVCQIREEVEILLDDFSFRSNLLALFKYNREQVRLSGIHSINDDSYGRYYLGEPSVVNMDASALLGVYQQELFNMSGEQLLSEWPVGILYFNVFAEEPGQFNLSDEGYYVINKNYRHFAYPIYAGMTNTIAALEEMGIDSTVWFENTDSISSITVYSYKEPKQDDYLADLLGVDREELKLGYVVSERKQIEQLLAISVPDGMVDVTGCVEFDYQYTLYLNNADSKAGTFRSRYVIYPQDAASFENKQQQ